MRIILLSSFWFKFPWRFNFPHHPLLDQPQAHTRSFSNCKGRLMSSTRLPRRVTDWSTGDVIAWLTIEGLSQYAGVFKTQEIDGRALLALDTGDLYFQLQFLMFLDPFEIHFPWCRRELGLPIGQRKKFEQAREKIRIRQASIASQSPAQGATGATRSHMPTQASGGYTPQNIVEPAHAGRSRGHQQTSYLRKPDLKKWVTTNLFVVTVFF